MEHECLFPIKVSLLILIVLLLGAAQFSYAQKTRKVSFSKSSLETNIISAEDGTEYQKINIKELQLTGEPGQPNLPVKYLRFLIPPNQDVANIVVNVKTSEVIKLSKKIFPSQPDIPTSIDYQGNEFVKPDPNVYDSDKPFPEELISVKRDGYFDGRNHIVTLEIYPVCYYPKLDYAEFYSEIEFSLEMKSSSKQLLKTPNRKEKYDKLYENALRHLIDNDEDISIFSTPRLNKGASVTSGPLPAYEYVIITTSSLSSSFSKFINWKRRKGLDIGLVTVEQISANYTGDLTSGINDEAGKIREYLKDSYGDGTVWALLAGDYSVVPIRYGCGGNNIWSSAVGCEYTNDYKIPTDLYFADFDGDWDVDGADLIDGIVRYGEAGDDNPEYESEIFVGRLLCSSSTDIVNWTEKVLKYEQNPGNGNTAYLTRSLMNEADEMQYLNQAESVSDYLPSIFDGGDDVILRELPSAYSSAPTYPTGADVITQFNNNIYGLWSWFNHGSPVGITAKQTYYEGTPRYLLTTLDSYSFQTPETGNGLDNLNNKDYPAVVYSISCTITPFDDHNPCNWYNEYRNMGEGFTVMGQYGGPALLGNTRNGLLLDSYQLYWEFAELIDNGNTNLGLAEMVSKSTVGHHYLSYSHNLIGCPETRLWTATPSSFGGTSVTDNGNSISISTGGISNCNIVACSIDNGATYFSEVEGSSATFTTAVRPLYITITKSNYLPFIGITGGTISSSITFTGSLKVLGNLTVNNGATLTSDPGTILTFTNGASLNVGYYGLLNANGTTSSPITFDFVSPNSTTENGIKFTTSSAMGTINCCQIRNAYRGIYQNGVSINVTNTAISGCYNGIYLSGSSPTIQYCNIHDNTNAGIYLINYSSPYLYNNYMTNNYYGVFCSTSSNPKFGNSSTQGKNGLTNNYCGVYCYNNSLPVLGKSSPLDGGYNNLVNAAHNINNASSGTVYAHHVWWGTTTPANFKIYGSGTTSYTDYLSSSVTISPAPPLSKAGGGLYASESSEIPMLSELDKAYELVSSNNLSEARAVCLNLINNYPDYSVSYNALNLLKETYTDKETTSKSNIYGTLFREKGNKDLYAMAGLILSDIDKENKLKRIDEVIEKYKGESIIELALFDKFVYYYFEMENEKSARAISDELDAQFPKSVGAIEAHKILGDEEYLKLNWELQPETDTTKQVTEANKFVLNDNYPNPFNPTTTISYSLPEAGNVQIKIYDVLGRELAKLVDEIKSAGKHTAAWNGSDNASGIYFYTITFNNQTLYKKMLMIK